MIGPDAQGVAVNRLRFLTAEPLTPGTVAGQPVTGDECNTGGDGTITITNPKFGTSGAVNRAIHSAASGQCRIGCVHDGIRRNPRDVAFF